MSYDNNMKLSIWKNEKKTTDKHPDFTGSGEVDGVEYWVSAWRRGKDDNPKVPALKLSLQKKDDVHRKGVDSAKDAIDNNFVDDDLPF